MTNIQNTTTRTHLPSLGFHGGEQRESLPSGGFHGDGQRKPLP